MWQSVNQSWKRIKGLIDKCFNTGYDTKIKALSRMGHIDWSWLSPTSPIFFNAPHPFLPVVVSSKWSHKHKKVSTIVPCNKVIYFLCKIWLINIGLNGNFATIWHLPPVVFWETCGNTWFASNPAISLLHLTISELGSSNTVTLKEDERFW